MTRNAIIIRLLLVAGLFCITALVFDACQSSPQSSSVQSTRPRSREAAGSEESLPFEADTSNRWPIDSDGGVVEYRQCRVAIPRGAVPEPIFVEVAIPDTPPRDVLEDTAYQVNPDSLELLKDGLITLGYYDDQVPAGKDEEDLVIVHQVNGVWVELNNSKVHIYNNTIEAPIHFLGLYAIRIASYDPRRLNTPPVASFQYSTDPFPEAVGRTAEDAQREMGIPGEEPGEEGTGEEVGLLNVNKATVEQLKAIPGLDETVAIRIVEFRNQYGDFITIDDLAQVEGLGVTSSKRLKQFLVTGYDELEEGEVVPAEGGGTARTESRVRELRLVAGPEDEAEQAGNVVEAAAPEAMVADDAAGPLPVESGLPQVTVYFNASGSHDPDGKIVQYDWDFDADGIFDYTSHASPYAEHTFNYNGNYSVVLKVTDNGRYAQSGFGTGLIQVRSARAEPKPLAANISCFPAYGPVPVTVNLASTVTGGTPPYAYTWTFDDGSESNLANPYTTYPDPGTYTIRFTVTDVAGGELSGGLTVLGCSPDTPSTPQPRMELDISPGSERGVAPLTAKFQLKTERATEPVTYRVVFGDEAPGEVETVLRDTYFTHEYQNSGFYMVKVIATDADLRTASTFATVHAISPDIERDFTVSSADAGGDPFSFGHDMRITVDYTGHSARSVQFVPDNPPADASELSFQWDFGDGTYSTEYKPEHTFAADGVFEVHLTASDGVQRWRHRLWVPVSEREPAVAIQAPAYVEGPVPLSLNLEAVVTRGEQPFTYDWRIGNARRSDPSTFYTFQMPGDYTINLDVEDKWHNKIHAPRIEVKVRPGPVDYRQPLAVIEPMTGSTRAVVVDLNGANPLPLSSPYIEGPVKLVDLSSDGQRLAIVGEEGLLMKRVSNGRPIVALLPAAGEIVAVRALNSDAALCSVVGNRGADTWLLRPDSAPCLVGGGEIVDCSGTGSTVVLGPDPAYGQTRNRVIRLDLATGRTMDEVDIPGVYTTDLGGAQLALADDGRTLFYVDDELRLVRRELAEGTEEYLSTSPDLKYGLAVSDDGGAVAFVSQRGEERDVIYGRYSMEGDFRLASVTDLTGFCSEHLALGADGRYLLGYGSRRELEKLVDVAKAGVPADPGAVAEETAAALAVAETAEGAGTEESVVGEDMGYQPSPQARRDRFGVVRLDLSRSPDTWNIISVDARFVAEAGAVYDIAGPFGR